MIQRKLLSIARSIKDMFGSRFGALRDNVVSQKLLLEGYRYLRGSQQRPSFRDVGFGAYSEHDEDGILLHIRFDRDEHLSIRGNLCGRRHRM
jgi:hypothetical protein